MSEFLLDTNVIFELVKILAIDQAVADRWGGIAAKALAAKSPLPVINGLLAATALKHNLTLVTRNTRGVAIAGVSVFNPWPS